MYKISDHGDVINTDTNKVIKPKWNGSGLQVELRQEDGKTKIFYVHDLVATHFVPNPRNLRIVVSSDGDRSNCRVDNLKFEDERANNVEVEPLAFSLTGGNKKLRAALSILKAIDELVNQVEELLREHWRVEVANVQLFDNEEDKIYTTGS